MSEQTRIYQAADGSWIYFDGTVKHTGLIESEAWQMSREQDYITKVREANRAIWEGVNQLKALQREWNALNYTEELDDGEGANAGITAAQIGSVVFDTTDALIALLDQGHATNIARLL
jgi:hypothetical protein